MKRLQLISLLALLIITGAIGFYGCSSSTGNPGGENHYRLQIYAQPPQVQIGGKDSIFCFLRFGDGVNDTIATDQTLYFRASSGAQSNLTSQALSANNAMGTDPTVYHFPNFVTTSTDTIFVVCLDDVQDTLAEGFTVVQILP